MSTNLVVNKSDVDQLVITTQTTPVVVDQYTTTLVLTEQPAQNIVSIASSNQSVVATKTTTLAVTTVETAAVVTAQGAQGPQGPPGASTTFVYILAAENLGGNRVVSTNSLGKLVYPDLTQLDQTVIGITTGSASADTLAEVQISGLQVEPSWSWLPNLPIFVGASGTLTQTVPATNTVLQIARPVTQTKIFIDLQQPIYLE